MIEFNNSAKLIIMLIIFVTSVCEYIILFIIYSKMFAILNVEVESRCDRVLTINKCR